MSRKSIGATILVVVIIALGVGAYAVAHNSNNSSSTGSTSNASSTYSNPSSNSSASAQSSQKPEQKIGDVLVVKTDASLGQYLATPSGQALYTYGADSAGVSNCTSGCLAEWPAYQDKGSTTGLPANVETFKRADNGQVQFTYKGMPLYTFVDDTAGQVTGNNVDKFQVAKI